MTTDTNNTSPAQIATPLDEPVRIRAHHSVVRNLGDWTTSRRLEGRLGAISGGGQ